MDEFQVNIKKGKSVAALKGGIAKHLGVDAGSLRLLLDGVRVRHNAMVHHVFEDGDELDVMVHQLGGGLL